MINENSTYPSSVIGAGVSGVCWSILARSRRRFSFITFCFCLSVAGKCAAVLSCSVRISGFVAVG